MEVVELLRFAVAPGAADAFVARNEEVWTPALRAQPGFLRREVLVDAERDEVVILVYWRDRRALEAFPAAREEALAARMAELVRGEERWVFARALPAGAEEGEPGPRSPAGG